MAYRILCGVPKSNCIGSVASLSFGLDPRKEGKKSHTSSVEAFRCHAGWLVSQGFERLAPREFRAPDGSGIRVIGKPTHFGVRLRGGKSGEGTTGNRFMPRKRTGGSLG